MSSQVVPTLQLPIIGVFTWNVPENKLYGDEVYARIYGLDLDELLSGIPIEMVIERICEADRERAARSTHASIVGGKLGTINYRISSGAVLQNVSAYGKCLRDNDGTPSFFTGGVALNVSFALDIARYNRDY